MSTARSDELELELRRFRRLCRDFLSRDLDLRVSRRSYRSRDRERAILSG